MIKILRISLHPLRASQLRALREKYGEDINIISIQTPIEEEDIGNLLDSIKPDVVEAVLSLDLWEVLFEECKKRNIELIRAKMKKSKDGKGLKFEGYKRIKQFIIESEDI